MQWPLKKKNQSQSEKISLIYSLLTSIAVKGRKNNYVQGLQKSSEQIWKYIWRQNISINEVYCKNSSKIDMVDNFIVKLPENMKST